MLVDMGEAQGQELLTLQPGQTRTVSQPVHPPPSSLGSSHYYNDKNPIDALSTISIRGSPGSFKRSSPSSSPNKYPGTSEATHPHAQAKSSGGGSAFLWILLDVLACRREEASTRYSFDGGSEAASTAHWTAQAPPLAPASPPAANGELISGSLEPLFAHGCEIQCHVTVKGVVSALMPELAAGISTRAVAIPQLVAHQGADSAADASGVSLETEVQWLERFVIRLPSELCEVLLDKGHRLDPQVSLCSTLSSSSFSVF